MGPILMIIGALLLAVGGLVTLLSKAGFKGLPGDIFIQKGSTSFFFPIVSCIVLSIILTIVINLFRR